MVGACRRQNRFYQSLRAHTEGPASHGARAIYCELFFMVKSALSSKRLHFQRGQFDASPPQRAFHYRLFSGQPDTSKLPKLLRNTKFVIRPHEKQPSQQSANLSADDYKKIETVSRAIHFLISDVELEHTGIQALIDAITPVMDDPAWAKRFITPHIFEQLSDV